jgi:hypothetical protein
MTVQELIDALQQYPKDYDVFLFVDPDRGVELGSIEVNPVSGTVDLFAE